MFVKGFQCLAILLSWAFAAKSLDLGPLTCANNQVLDGGADMALLDMSRDVVVLEQSTCTIAGVSTTGTVVVSPGSTVIFQATEAGRGSKVGAVEGDGAAAVILQSVELTAFNGLFLTNANEVHLSESVSVVGNVILEGVKTFTTHGGTVHGRVTVEGAASVSLHQWTLHGSLTIRNCEGDVIVGNSSMLDSSVTIEGGFGHTKLQDSEVKGTLSLLTHTGPLTLIRSSFLEDVELRNTTGSVEVLHCHVAFFTSISEVRGHVFFRSNQLMGDVFIGDIRDSVYLESNNFNARRLEARDIGGVLDVLLNQNLAINSARNMAVSIQDSTILDAVLFQSEMGFILEDNTFQSLSCLENGSTSMARNTVATTPTGQCSGASFLATPA
mmetsp:Transcript_4742/g.13152  ORF Transcript_4742/g.13152 Transcript_4742/m.13152 type:complete len:384 (+) Transcript_4742:236-1387(+)|eukprot:CAMPEP_0117651592 /NCGR_PEP_ID=MMETSP0804-20121206/2176_1 /TAXON_ID=1074897 /ORGANISM="Tetraselmis astigmatica, Strain CCMP880" /LENGTH=383 /DNA_ID=CAMNT_0005457583 /DNA_START=160 /DNA_END=1311 /DNA_ORIENTATION=+